MAYCAPRGIPHSTFLSWPVADRAAALAWAADQRQRCPSCGTHPLDHSRDEPDPLVAVAQQCLGCRQLGEARRSVPEELRDFTHVAFVPRSTATAERQG